jgi:hypothetical protein
MLTLCSIILSMLLQAGGIFNSEEKLGFDKASNADSRIKIYLKASIRIQKSIQSEVAKENFQAAANDMKTWTTILDESLKDIEANLKTKKKSTNLIRYEIQVRKAITDSQNYKLKAPFEQQDLFESCLKQAEYVRKKFVDILFKRD